MLKKIIKSTIKWVVSIGLIAYLLNNTDIGQVKIILAQANVAYLIAAFALCFVGYFISSNRWRLLMTLTGSAPKIMYLVQSFMVSIFFNNLLPSTIGGDASRTVDTWRVSGNKSKAFAVVFLDRFLGVYVLFLYASIGYFYYKDKLNISSLSWFILLGIISATCFLFFIIFQPVSASKLGNILSFLPSKWRQVKTQIIGTFYQVADDKKTLIRALSLSFLLQINVVFHYYLIAKGLNINIPLFALFMIVPISLIILMAPISVNGIGLRETVFVLLFGLFSISKEMALSFSFVIFMMIIAQGILGGLVYLFRKVPTAHQSSNRKNP